MRKFSQLAVVLALALSLGGHWAVLQSMAWTSMVIKSFQTDSLKVALAKTFDGRHPCSICLFVAAGKKADEQKQSTRHIQIPQLDLLLEELPTFQFGWEGDLPPRGAREACPTRLEPPPSPPPRFA